MQEVSNAVELFLSHQWVTASAATIFLLVRLLKSKRMPWPIFLIPPKARTLVAVVLGFAGAGVQSVALGVAWPQALAENMIACLVAILTHDVVIEWFREGREFGAK